MNTIVLNSVPLRISPDALAALLKIEKKNPLYNELASLVQKGLETARPKAVYKPVFVDERGDDFVFLEGVKFHSRVLAVNLAGIYRAFPFIATCGTELEEWADSLDDAVHKYWAEAFMALALLQAIKYLDEHIRDNFKIKKISHLSPGSINDWKLEEQVPLFKLLGDVENSIGVKLTKSHFMNPAKTISGIKFPSEFDFESCMLCERKACVGRRADFSKEMWTKYFGKSGKSQ